MEQLVFMAETFPSTLIHIVNQANRSTTERYLPVASVSIQISYSLCRLFDDASRMSFLCLCSTARQKASRIREYSLFLFFFSQTCLACRAITVLAIGAERGNISRVLRLHLHDGNGGSTHATSRIQSIQSNIR